MRLEPLFHFCFYLTLAVASACLAISSAFFVIWMPGLLVLTLVLLFLAWRHEGRWLLSDTAANHLGVFIAIGAVGWILFQVPRSEEDFIAGGVPWPAGLLPHLGPLLMVLLVVKAFRPKRLPDFWVIQTIGLMMVTLAAVLADAPGFGVLMLLYLLSMVWCLALYYPVREQRLLSAPADAGQVPLFLRVEAARWSVPGRWGGGLRVIRWTLVVLVLGHVLFLSAPRQAPSYWVARQLSPAVAQAMRTGIEPGIDLNRIGRVELSEKPAFEAQVTGADGAAAELPGSQHWQVELYEFYASGRWYPLGQAQERLRRVDIAPTRPVPVQRGPVALADGEVYVTFELKPSAAGGLALVEPVDVLDVGRSPHIDGNPDPLGLFNVFEGCDALIPMIQGRRRLYQYGQRVKQTSAATRFPAAVSSEAYRKLLTDQGVPLEMLGWTRRVLQKRPELASADRAIDPEQGLPAGAHAKVAEALCRHLAQSGEFRYSLELRRQDTDLDPAVDFLLNVKEGHCERYAGALALMLRSVGIPCRVVKGYLGANSEEPGRYIILQNQAHSWVQALVPDEQGDWQWLVLDPTPSTEAQARTLEDWLRWVSEVFDTRTLWRRLVLEYNPEEQAVAAQILQQQLTAPRTYIALGFLLGLVPAVWVTRRAWHWLRVGLAQRMILSRRVSADAVLYDRLLQLLVRRLGMRPSAGQTPREFAVQAAEALGRHGVGAELSDLPRQVVACYYAGHYGGCALQESARLRLEEQLQKLAKQSLAT
jgi:transglutaminase-like putative cysteine protease